VLFILPNRSPFSAFCVFFSAQQFLCNFKTNTRESPAKLHYTHTEGRRGGGGAVRAWADPHYPFIRPLLTIAAGHVISTSSKGSKGSKAAKAAGAAATAAIFNPSH